MREGVMILRPTFRLGCGSMTHVRRELPPSRSMEQARRSPLLKEEMMSNVRMTRREFLRTMAVGAGALSVAPLLEACAAPAPAVSPREAFKIGSILPYTKVYAGLGESITNGMTLYFES